MESVQLEKSELLALLDLVDVNGIIGLEPKHLPTPEPFERSIILDDGRSRLLENHRLSVAEDHYEIDRELKAMLAIIADPQAVVRVERTTSSRDEDLSCWYYVSGPELVLLVAGSPELFELVRVGDLSEALNQIVEILPVAPAPAAVRYRAIADQEDADLIARLAADWDEVPALTILEADGLASNEAIQFYDDLTKSEWRGLVDFMACSSGQVKTFHRFFALQGQEFSWLAWQAVPEERDLHIQTANAGAFEELLTAYLSQLIP